jgi:hypothetical protein
MHAPAPFVRSFLSPPIARREPGRNQHAEQKAEPEVSRQTPHRYVSSLTARLTVSSQVKRRSLTPPHVPYDESHQRRVADGSEHQDSLPMVPREGPPCVRRGVRPRSSLFSRASAMPNEPASSNPRSSKGSSELADPLRRRIKKESTGLAGHSALGSLGRLLEPVGERGAHDVRRVVLQVVSEPDR